MTTTATNNFSVFGIDISRYQGNEINFLNKQVDTLSFYKFNDYDLCNSDENAFANFIQTR
ncbi:hypothetical protein [Flavobacterium sp. N1736]|uniref:hypothetical protein n=1 Tax=Flavobacterium sp. N1736 TaxID=2986823 RepID=UPI0022254D4E|nr:hypothetical protein [Flavobacterium sp. N1736]